MESPQIGVKCGPPTAVLGSQFAGNETTTSFYLSDLTNVSRRTEQVILKPLPCWKQIPGGEAIFSLDHSNL